MPFMHNFSNVYFGVTGFISQPNKREVIEDLIQHLPFDRLLLETDAPLIWHERVKRPIIPNPGHVLYQAMSVSELTGRKLVDVCNQTTYDAVRMYNLPDLK